MTRLPRSSERGAAAVEMALVLPVLLLILFGIVDFGRLLYTQVELSSAAREGARVLAMGHPELVDTRVQAAQSLGTVNVAGTTACPDPAAAADEATVDLSTTFQWITPLGPIADLITGGGSVADNDLTVTASGSMRCGG